MRYIDYAVYTSGVIVPLLLLPPLGIIGIMDDEDAGHCRIVFRQRRARR